jgi:PTH1 family peptidyl-tRNA hydrolase
MGVKFKLVVGLGNPGKEYRDTHHNVGFLALDYLARRTAPKAEFLKANSRKFEFLKAEDYILVKSLTFMNQSGGAVRAALNHFHLKPEQMLLIHDDSDIELGRYKFSFGRGSAGHRGVQSAIEALKTKNFGRLRVGIRRRTMRGRAGELVLKKISKSDLGTIKEVFGKITTLLHNS